MNLIGYVIITQYKSITFHLARGDCETRSLSCFKTPCVLSKHQLSAPVREYEYMFLLVIQVIDAVKFKFRQAWSGASTSQIERDSLHCPAGLARVRRVALLINISWHQTWWQQVNVTVFLSISQFILFLSAEVKLFLILISHLLPCKGEVGPFRGVGLF